MLVWGNELDFPGEKTKKQEGTKWLTSGYNIWGRLSPVSICWHSAAQGEEALSLGPVFPEAVHTISLWVSGLEVWLKWVPA
jgi:hypothetical protein